jgi:hypothetical protein
MKEEENVVKTKDWNYCTKLSEPAKEKLSP